MSRNFIIYKSHVISTFTLIHYLANLLQLSLTFTRIFPAQNISSNTFRYKIISILTLFHSLMMNYFQSYFLFFLQLLFSVRFNSSILNIFFLRYVYTRTSNFITAMTWTSPKIKHNSSFTARAKLVYVFILTQVALHWSGWREKLYQRNSKCGKCFHIWHLSNRTANIKIIKAILYEKFSKAFDDIGRYFQAREFSNWKWDIAQLVFNLIFLRSRMFWSWNF